MKLNVTQKMGIKGIKLNITLDDGQAMIVDLVSPNAETGPQPEALAVILREMQRVRPSISFDSEDGELTDVIEEWRSLSAVASNQEQAIDELREQRETTVARIQELETALSEAEAANRDHVAEKTRLKEELEKVQAALAGEKPKGSAVVEGVADVTEVVEPEKNG